jgi:hypothetical protein
MSTTKRNDATLISVDPSAADVLRQQTLVTLEANHYYFEEILGSWHRWPGPMYSAMTSR